MGLLLSAEPSSKVPGNMKRDVLMRDGASTLRFWPYRHHPRRGIVAPPAIPPYPRGCVWDSLVGSLVGGAESAACLTTGVNTFAMAGYENNTFLVVRNYDSSFPHQTDLLSPVGYQRTSSNDSSRKTSRLARSVTLVRSGTRAEQRANEPVLF